MCDQREREERKRDVRSCRESDADLLLDERALALPACAAALLLLVLCCLAIRPLLAPLLVLVLACGGGASESSAAGAGAARLGAARPAAWPFSAISISPSLSLSSLSLLPLSFPRPFRPSNRPSTRGVGELKGAVVSIQQSMRRRARASKTLSPLGFWSRSGASWQLATLIPGKVPLLIVARRVHTLSAAAACPARLCTHPPTPFVDKQIGDRNCSCNVGEVSHQSPTSCTTPAAARRKRERELRCTGASKLSASLACRLISALLARGERQPPAAQYSRGGSWVLRPSTDGAPLRSDEPPERTTKWRKHGWLVARGGGREEDGMGWQQACVREYGHVREQRTTWREPRRKREKERVRETRWSVALWKWMGRPFC